MSVYCYYNDDYYTEIHFSMLPEPLPYLQLISGNSSREGFLQLVKDGTVYPVCDEGITDFQINQICVYLGYRNRSEREKERKK